MIKRTCDRCGKEMEANIPYFNPFPSPKIIATVNIDGNPRGLDLCPECEEKLMTYIFFDREDVNDQ